MLVIFVPPGNVQVSVQPLSGLVPVSVSITFACMAPLELFPSE